MKSSNRCFIFFECVFQNSLFAELEVPDDKTGLRLMFHLYLCEYLFVKMIIQLHQIRENPDRGTDTWKNDNFAILY